VSGIRYKKQHTGPSLNSNNQVNEISKVKNLAAGCGVFIIVRPVGACSKVNRKNPDKTHDKAECGVV